MVSYKYLCTYSLMHRHANDITALHHCCFPKKIFKRSEKSDTCSHLFACFNQHPKRKLNPSAKFERSEIFLGHPPLARFIPKSETLSAFCSVEPDWACVALKVCTDPPAAQKDPFMIMVWQVIHLCVNIQPKLFVVWNFNMIMPYDWSPRQHLVVRGVAGVGG